MLPGHWGDVGDVRHILSSLLACPQLRQDGHIVEDDAVGDQSATLMPEVLVIFRRKAQFPKIGVRNSATKLMIAFAPIERSLDVLAQTWRVYKIEQIETANDIVVFPQRLARLVFSSIGVEFVDNDTLRRGFERQRDENALQVLPFFHDQLGIEFAYGFQEDIAILMGVLEAIERRAKFLLDGFIAWRELIPEEMQQSKIHQGASRACQWNAPPGECRWYC